MPVSAELPGAGCRVGGGTWPPFGQVQGNMAKSVVRAPVCAFAGLTRLTLRLSRPYALDGRGIHGSRAIQHDHDRLGR